MDGFARRSTPGFLLLASLVRDNIVRNIGSKSMLRSAGSGDVPVSNCERNNDL
jgi:hypothetical protein